MLGNAHASSSYSSLIALKPRQVLLLEQQERTPSVLASMAKGNPGNLSELNPEDDSTLTYSIALWLETKGFSKVLKRFLSAAQIEDDTWRGKALNLNEIFSKYLEIRNEVQKDLKPQNKQVVGTTLTNGDAKCDVSDEVKGKKKKKQGKKNASVADDAKTPEDTADNEKLSESRMDVKEGVDQSTIKQKDKKRKSKLLSQSLESDVQKTVEPAEVGVSSSKKASKKRKLDVEENENQFVQEVVAEEPKSKKTKKSLKEGKNVPPEITLPGADEPILKPNEGETAQIGEVGPENGIAKEIDESTEVALENNGVNKSHSKSGGKNNKSSAEPKTANAFQRVKIEDVKFADDRLQDNSYWAKDGAEIGYGAKAQEVLGQVRGRDFRHEKTKKKRGSYRGGQIDLQSHSVKFNYSDEE